MANQPESANTQAAAPPARVRSIDVLRGAVMALMVIDHARVFLSGARFDPTNLARSNPALFFTRWVTHFCAPVFLFLVGVGAFLHLGRARSKRALSVFLFTRGVWLILIELIVMRFAWTFNFDYEHYMLGGVIWMIGWCMVLLGALVWLPRPLILLFALAMIFGHNALGPVLNARARELRSGPWAGTLTTLYFGGPISMGGPTLFILFTIVPWVGVAAAGYAFGKVLTLDSRRRDRLCLAIGGGAVLLFVVLRAINSYGDARPWSAQPTALMTACSFLNTSKYPASLQFLLMTLGPAIALIPMLERCRGWFTGALATIGRVPFFFYVLHVPLIHLVACGLSLARYGKVIPWLTANQPIMPGPAPDGYGYSLGIVYLISAAVIVGLYFPCRWMARVKARRTGWWLGYV